MENRQLCQSPVAACLLFLLPTGVGLGAGTLAAQPPGRPALGKVLARWWTAYERGDIDLRELARQRGIAEPVYGTGWLPDRPGDMSHRVALAALLGRIDHPPDREAVEVALQLAGLEQSHVDVRHLARLALSGLDDPASVVVLIDVARGDFGGWSGRRARDRVGAQAAAILALCAMGQPVARPIVQARLGDPEPRIRMAAAEGLRQLCHPRALPGLTLALATESQPVVAQALVQAVATTLARAGAKVDARELRAALEAVIALIGRTDWRTDREIVQLLRELRSRRSIPPLIRLLGRFDPDGPRVDPSLMSGMLHAATHDALQSLTGAGYGRSDFAAWRDFWEREQDRLVVAPRKALDPGRTTSGFFGIPVEGTNIVFVIDVSGSMRAAFFPAGDYEPTADDDGLTRMLIAKRELLAAVAALPQDTHLNLITFASRVKRWRPQLVRMSGQARTGLREKVMNLRPDGGTNLYGALELALDLQTFRYGERYGVPIDEVFLLSDGTPSTGDITDPGQILAAIREANRYRRVVIHTLYMGGGGDSDFMRRLAEENGGRYVRL